MKNKYINILASALLVTGLISCNEEGWNTPNQDNVGELQLGKMNISLKDADRIIVRSATRGENIDEFSVTILDGNKNEVVEYKYGDMPEVVALPVGENYVIKVESHDIKDAEFDNPYYEGESETFAIQPGKLTRIENIVAKFASLKVSIKFDDELKKYLGSDAQVTVKGSNGSQLIFTPGDENRSGYFALGESTTFAAHFEAIIDGVKTTSHTPFQDVKKGDHHIITYSIKGTPTIPDPSGQFGSDDENGGVNVDVRYEKTDQDANTTVIEDTLDDSDRPGKEDSQDPDDNKGNEEDPGQKPGGEDDPSQNESKIEFIYPEDSWLKEGVSQNASDFDKEKQKAYLVVKSPSGISEFWVNIESDNPDFKDSLENEFNLKTNFDLADSSPDNQTLLETFKELGFPTGEEVKNKNEVTFDISDFVNLLDMFKGEHKFIITIIDNDNNKKSSSIIILGKGI